MKYDDLAGLDLKGKALVYLSGGPSFIPGPLRSHYQSAGERWKNLARVGAVEETGEVAEQSADLAGKGGRHLRAG